MLPPRKDIPSFGREREARMALLHQGESSFPSTESVLAALVSGLQHDLRKLEKSP